MNRIVLQDKCWASCLFSPGNLRVRGLNNPTLVPLASVVYLSSRNWPSCSCLNGLSQMLTGSRKGGHSKKPPSLYLSCFSHEASLWQEPSGVALNETGPTIKQAMTIKKDKQLRVIDHSSPEASRQAEPKKSPIAARCPISQLSPIVYYRQRCGLVYMRLVRSCPCQEQVRYLATNRFLPFGACLITDQNAATLNTLAPK